MHIQSVGGSAGGWLILDGLICQAVDWLSAGVAEVTGPHVPLSTLAWSFSQGAGIPVTKRASPFQASVRFMFINILLACVSHMASPNSRGGKK